MQDDSMIVNFCIVVVQVALLLVLLLLLAVRGHSGKGGGGGDGGTSVLQSNPDTSKFPSLRLRNWETSMMSTITSYPSYVMMCTMLSTTPMSTCGEKGGSFQLLFCDNVPLPPTLLTYNLLRYFQYLLPNVCALNWKIWYVYHHHSLHREKTEA